MKMIIVNQRKVLFLSMDAMNRASMIGVSTIKIDAKKIGIVIAHIIAYCNAIKIKIIIDTISPIAIGLR